jgi:ABC-2 type transport system permease protein
VANYLVATTFAVVTGIATALAAIAMGLPAEGSFAMGASYAGVGIAVLGIAALIGQVTGTSRTANALTATVIGIAYLIRAGADVNATDETPAWYSWLSPIGWGQQVRAYGENRWWPLLISVGVGIALCVAAILIEERRDLGSSLLPERRGARQASRSLRSGLGLSLRLQRGPIIGWTIASVFSAAFYGAIVQAMLGVLSPDSDYAKAFIGDSGNIVDALLGLLLVFAALMVGAFAVQSALVLHTEEADGLTETLWSGARSRVSWLLSRLALPVLGSAVLLALTGAAMGASFGTSVDDPAQVGTLALAALNYWPSVLLTVGIVALAAAFVPRAATAIGWGVLSLSVLVSLFGELLSLPDWITGNTPFTAVARMPAEAFDPWSFLVISALGLAALVAALLRYRSRDMRSL